MNQNIIFQCDISVFKKISQMPIAYWLSNKTVEIFEKSKSFEVYGETKKGVLTGNDARFGRFWFEVNFQKTCNYNKNHSDMIKNNKKWIMCTSGGPFRKWYGNFEWVVNLENNGKEIRENVENSSRLRDPYYYFKECFTWSEISSKALSIRYVPEGILFGNSGPCCFINDDNLYYYMSLINSKIAFCMFKVLSPTLTFGPDQLKRLPIKIENADCVKKITGENISFSKTDWDSFETSWDFKKHPLI